MPNNDAFIEVLAEMAEASDVMELRVQVMHALDLFGIRAAYFVAPLTQDPRIGRVLTNLGYARVWERQYRARLYLVDPLPTASLDFSNAFLWPAELDRKKLNRKQKRYLEIVTPYGLGCGIGVACYGPRGRAGFLGVAWPEGEPLPKQIRQAVHQIGQTSFHRYCQLMREDIDIEPPSNRELEVLSWMCQGKSNPEMASLIGVSRSSIDAYIRRIFAKLDVTDRTAACVRAYSLGLVDSDEVQRFVALALEREES